MAKRLSSNEIKSRFHDKPWASPFKKIVAVADERNKLIQIYEEHARGKCSGAAAWSAYHYKRTSSIVLSSWRDGARDVFLLKAGRAKLQLVPSLSPAGIEEAKIVANTSDRSREIHITYTGLAGGGVGATLCRALAEGVKGAVIHSEGGGNRMGRATLILPLMHKVNIGIDDTDKGGEGATWSLANELGYTLCEEKGIEYLNHTIVQLYPGTPAKTTNCVSTVLTFAVEPAKKNYLIEKLSNLLRNYTLSDDTGMAVFEGLAHPRELTVFADKARRSLVTVEDARSVAANTGAILITITGELGTIGALAGLGYAERLEEAVVVSEFEAPR